MPLPSSAPDASAAPPLPAAQPPQAPAPPQPQPQPQAPTQAPVQAPTQAPAAPAPPQSPYAPPGSAPVRGTFSSLPVVDDSLAGTRRKPRHGEPLVGRALRAVRRTVSSSAAREVAEASRTAETLQQPVATGRQIAVTSIRGGAGKSTVSALLGRTYAHYRHDPVLLVEADPALGTLPFRLGAPSLRWTVRDLAEMLEPSMSLLDVTGYLVQLPDNAWLLPGSKGEVGAMIDTKAYEKAMVALRRYFGVTVVDCETLPAEVARTALSAAHSRVLVAPATFEGVASTHSVLQWMAGLPRQVVAGTVVVLTEAVPHGGLDIDKAVQKLRATGATVHLLPYDRHLAAGGEINTELLAHATREAVTHIAAEALSLSLRR
ncbi:MinD/ParA family protein [Streptomyces sp. B-S-A6]|uniref:MinD/ParA family protein n=1 Tax=Streptomyces cavernicola TaxID=3043613 RepID=A0ABT6SK79_9ACTN|nr:MinD/ParA family protein [Streptomyces sp. B-S-A6]MDI3408591.1 MinD/ParA family protein [Streptomyces sp. B-S-A6]